jgi:hypothetical protein
MSTRIRVALRGVGGRAEGGRLSGQPERDVLGAPSPPSVVQAMEPSLHGASSHIRK